MQELAEAVNTIVPVAAAPAGASRLVGRQLLGEGDVGPRGAGNRSRGHPGQILGTTGRSDRPSRHFLTRRPGLSQGLIDPVLGHLHPAAQQLQLPLESIEASREFVHDDDYRVFSTQRACPDGHGSLPELEPRLFSFNSPIGACSHCDGLGQIHSFAEDLLVRDPELSPRDGGLACITAEGRLAYSRFTLEHLDQVAAEYGFDMDTPWGKLTARQRKVLLFGTADVEFDFHWRREGARYSAKGRDRRSFPGIIPHLERVYRGATARHLDRFRAATACPHCEGTRLNEVARSVRFEGRDLPTVLAWPVRRAREYFDGVVLEGNAARMAPSTPPHGVSREIGMWLCSGNHSDSKPRASTCLASSIGWMVLSVGKMYTPNCMMRRG